MDNYYPSIERTIIELSHLTYCDDGATAEQDVAPQIAALPTARLQFQAYIQSAVCYSGTAEWILIALEDLLPQGKKMGNSEPSTIGVMAVTIRRAIDAVAPLLVVHPNMDTDSYALELVTLFDRATCKE